MAYVTRYLIQLRFDPGTMIDLANHKLRLCWSKAKAILRDIL